VAAADETATLSAAVPQPYGDVFAHQMWIAGEYRGATVTLTAEITAQDVAGHAELSLFTITHAEDRSQDRPVFPAPPRPPAGTGPARPPGHVQAGGPDLGLPARRADRAERLAGRLRAGVEHVLRGAGLDDDHAEGVGDDVVELAPDPGLLLGDRPPGLQLLLAAAARGPAPQLTHVSAAQPPQRRETQAEHHNDEPGPGCDTAGRGPQRPGQHGPGGDARPGRLPPRAVRRHRAQCGGDHHGHH
jgi:hypothetical protein